MPPPRAMWFYLAAGLSSAVVPVLLPVWELRPNIDRLRLGAERRVGQAVAPGTSDTDRSGP